MSLHNSTPAKLGLLTTFGLIALADLSWYIGLLTGENTQTLTIALSLFAAIFLVSSLVTILHRNDPEPNRPSRPSHAVGDAMAACGQVYLFAALFVDIGIVAAWLAINVVINGWLDGNLDFDWAQLVKFFVVFNCVMVGGGLLGLAWGDKLTVSPEAGYQTEYSDTEGEEQNHGNG